MDVPNNGSSIINEPRKPEKEFSFLVTTDNHMGYKYDDHLRRRDSFMAFKEALQIARERNVDFILLGGDLFHMNRPNATIEHKCIKILRHHMNAMVDKKATSFRRVAGEFSHYDQVKHGNFEDLSLTVPYPIMTIHGNHDDPTGPAGKSVVEKLATCGLLNYFGKVKISDEEIRIEPIVFEKDSLKLALYGIGFIPDRKLRAAWDDGLVTFKEPPSDTFNVIVVHQNRIKYSEGKFIPDSYFPKWFHLVIRGHEHDALPPEPIPESRVKGMVYQPGSTVATSIELRECTAKQVALMTVTLNNPDGDQSTRYRLQPEIIDLKCHRKMIFKDIYQKEIFEHIKATDTRRKLTQNEYRTIFRAYVVKWIDNALAAAEEERPHQAPTTGSAGSSNSSIYSKLNRFRLPLVRVRLEYKHKVECFDDLEINALFYPTQVANRDIIKFRQQKIVGNVNLTFDDSNPDTLNSNAEEEEYEVGQVEAIDLQEERKDTVDTMIMDYFRDKPESERLKAISLDEYTEAVRGAAEDGNVISNVLAKKKSAILFDYKSILTDENVAAQYFSSEDKVHKWFLSAFKGEKPKLPPGSIGSAPSEPPMMAEAGDEMDDVEIVWDDDFKA